MANSAGRGGVSRRQSVCVGMSRRAGGSRASGCRSTRARRRGYGEACCRDASEGSPVFSPSSSRWRRSAATTTRGATTSAPPAAATTSVRACSSVTSTAGRSARASRRTCTRPVRGRAMVRAATIRAALVRRARREVAGRGGGAAEGGVAGADAPGGGLAAVVAALEGVARIGGHRVGMSGCGPGSPRQGAAARAGGVGARSVGDARRVRPALR